MPVALIFCKIWRGFISYLQDENGSKSLKHSQFSDKAEVNLQVADIVPELPQFSTEAGKAVDNKLLRVTCGQITD